MMPGSPSAVPLCLVQTIKPDSSEELTAESLGALQTSLEGLPETSSPSPDAALT